MAKLTERWPVVQVDDFNALTNEWGSPFMDRRGQTLPEALTMLYVDSTITSVQKGTFNWNGPESVIDVTFCSLDQSQRSPGGSLLYRLQQQ